MTQLDDMDRISETFRGKTVLVTGGTGFIGKVLIEKLLRLCPDIKKIILIMRSKKGVEPKERIEEIFKNPLFNSLLSSRSLDKLLLLVTAVNGDMMEKDLGLNERDRAICQTANIIVHSAASIRFDDSIKAAVILNTRGTKYMLELAKQCKHLELFIHISTAYCHPEEKVLEERLYPPPNDPEEVIAIVETTDDAQLDILTPKLLSTMPNTYVYSKALAESLVESSMDSIPAVIVRPSVIVPIYIEPLKGWTDNINGPTGLMIGAGKGVLRTMYGNPDGYIDFVPVDCVVNGLMILIWDYSKNGNRMDVINFTTSDEIRLTWKELIDIGKYTAHKVPFDTILWYPGGSMTKCIWWHRIRAILFHWVPAILVDIMLFCFGYKTVLIRVQNKISKSFKVLEYYVNNQWSFKADKIKSLRAKLNKVEKSIYIIDSNGLDVNNYIYHATLSARRYILKDKDEDLPKAKLQMRIMWYMNLMVKIAFVIYMVYWITSKITAFF